MKICKQANTQGIYKILFLLFDRTVQTIESVKILAGFGLRLAVMDYCQKPLETIQKDSTILSTNIETVAQLPKLTPNSHRFLNYKQQMHHQHQHHHGHHPKPDQKFAKLRSLVQRSSYPADVTEFIISSCQHVLTYYQDLDCNTVTFYENFHEKTFVELKGKIVVNFKGSNYSVFMAMMIPQNYPMQPPLVRIINDNPMTNQVDHVYAPNQSQSDPHSYIIRHLKSCQNWQAFDSNLLSVVQQLSQILSHKFPFRKRKHGSTPPQYQSNVNPSSMSPYKVANQGANFNTHVNQDAYSKNMYPGANVDLNMYPGSNAGFVPTNSFNYTPPGGGNTGNMCKPTGAGFGFNNGGGGFNNGGGFNSGGGFTNTSHTPLPYYNPPHPPQPSNYADFNQNSGFNPAQGGFMGGFYPGGNQNHSNQSPGFGTAQSMKVGSGNTNDYVAKNSAGHTSPGYNNTPMGGQSAKNTTTAVTPKNNEKVNKAKQQILDYKKHTDTLLKQISSQVQTLRSEHTSLFTKSHNLDVISKVFTEQLTELKARNKQLHYIVQSSQNIQDVNWKQLVKPENQISEQILDLVSSSKAWEETSDRFEKEFAEDRIQLQDFLKVMRRIEQEKFLTKMMLARCLKYAIEN